jgi:hypothetical protein
MVSLDEKLQRCNGQVAKALISRRFTRTLGSTGRKQVGDFLQEEMEGMELQFGATLGAQKRFSSHHKAIVGMILEMVTSRTTSSEQIVVIFNSSSPKFPFSFSVVAHCSMHSQ